MLQAVLCSSLQKVFSDTKTLPDSQEALSFFSGERGSAQLCLRTDADAEAKVEVSSPIPCRIYEVREIYSSLPIYPNAERCTLLGGGKAGFYPDLLRPFTGAAALKKDKTLALWIELETDGVPAGDCRADFHIACGDDTAELALSVHIGKTALAPQTLIYTDWFHADCLASYYQTPVFGEEHWRIVENFMANAAAHGVNCLLTPLFTPPLDTEVGRERPTVQLVDVKKEGDRYAFGFSRLDRWIETAEKHGIRYFELSHLFTQWGAKAAPKIMAETESGYRRIFGWETDSLSPEYREFLRQFGAAITAYAAEKGLTDRIFVHCSDEPGEADLERYEQCAALIHSYFGAFRHIDALSHFDFYEKGLVQLPVPEEGSAEKFRGKVPDLWVYYCCGQYSNELPNRFFAMPSIRTRILGVLLYKYDCAGFLHWGFNFYYSCLSRRPVDPFFETDADHAFPSGDAFTVYPGENGTPLPSLREKVFYDGLQDLRALRAAEQRTSRETVLNLIRDTLGEIDFRTYPMEEITFLDFRSKLTALAEK